MHTHLERNEAKVLVKRAWVRKGDLFNAGAASSSVLARAIPLMWSKFARKCEKEDSPALNSLCESLGHKVDRTRYLWDEGTEAVGTERGDEAQDRGHERDESIEAGKDGEEVEQSDKHRMVRGEVITRSSTAAEPLLGEECLTELQVSPENLHEQVRWRDVLHKGIKGEKRHIEVWVSEQTQARMQNKTCSWHDRHMHFCDRPVDSEYLTLCASHMKEFRELLQLPLLRRQSAIGHLSDQELHDYAYSRVWPMVTTAIEELMPNRNVEERIHKIIILLQFKAALYTYRCFFNEDQPEFLLALLEWLRRALLIPTTAAVATFQFAVKASFAIFGICILSKDLWEALKVGCMCGVLSGLALFRGIAAEAGASEKYWLLLGGSLLGGFGIYMLGNWINWWYRDSPPSLGAEYSKFTKVVYQGSDLDLCGLRRTYY
jgi:hypothetical protein